MAELTNEKELSDTKNVNYNKLNATTLTTPDYIIHRRRLFSFLTSNTNIYVTRKRSFKAQLNRCEKLFDSGESEIIIHALGTSINRACILALELKEKYNGILDIEVNTSTVELTDDIEPLTDDYDIESINNRKKSAIHIRVFKIVDLGSLKYAN